MRKLIILSLLMFCTIAGYAIPSQIDYQIPKSSQKVPLIIIAPGNGYHKDLPLIKILADKAEKNNIAAVRFNWQFYSNKSKPSEKYAVEVNDVIDIIRKMKVHPQIDSQRVYIIGKSLGSVLAYRAALRDKNLKGIVLLTPIMPDTTGSYNEFYYPGILKEQRPVLFALGDNDADNCILKTLYKCASLMETTPDILVTQGDHGFNIEEYQEGKTSVKNDKNIDNITDLVIQWLMERK